MKPILLRRLFRRRKPAAPLNQRLLAIYFANARGLRSGAMTSRMPLAFRLPRRGRGW